MVTIHQYLDKYPISASSERLIVGTIHPQDHESFIVPFFYGNRNSIWKILNEAFHDEIGEPITLTGIINFLSKYKISVSDTICECERKTPSALDKDLKPIRLNYSILEQIRNSKIREIFFTSGFGKNNAFKIFYEDILNLKITGEIKSNRSVELDENFFGRKVKLTVLYSPSGTANTGIVKSKMYLRDKGQYLNSRRPVQDFKVDYYKKMFSN